MFFCGFCGRNFAAKYPGTAIADGNARFVDIFAASPPDAGPTFSFSGGLEPLTNPGVGALVRDAAAFGIRVPLITNGFMLTPQYLAKQPGLWQLDSLRVSLYGVDQASYARVTRRGDAFAQVRRNLIDFLRLRPRENRDLRVGINFIVLPGTADQIVPLARLIAEINDAAGADRGIDFLTLREDFSVPEEQSLPLEERRRLVGVFQEFDTLTRRTCPGLDVDYGFALWALEQGIVGRPLAMVTERGMRPKAFPQVSVVVDLLGDVYLYREAGFLERPGVGRYCIGRISAARPLAVVVREFVEKGKGIEPLGGDPALLDAFDHVVTLLLNRMDADASAGFGPEDGPVRLSAR
jgi:dTDP-4-amino-4,6-dideoxy-D-glucose ammonia-lyase